MVGLPNFVAECLCTYCQCIRTIVNGLFAEVCHEVRGGGYIKSVGLCHTSGCFELSFILLECHILLCTLGRNQVGLGREEEECRDLLVK